MATGTLARLAIAIGIDDSGVSTGITRSRGSILSGLKGITSASESAVAGSAASMEAHSSSALMSVGGLATGVVATVGTVIAGLGALAVQYESETAHIAAAAGVTSAQANKVGQDYLKAAGNSQTMIFTAKDMTDSYAAVAGQLALTDSATHVVTQDMAFMSAATDLAAGTNSKLSDATSAVSSVLQNFQLKIKDSADVSNVLFDASRGLHLSLGQTATTIEQLRGRLGASGPSLKDTATLVEIMSTHALSSSQNIRLFAGALNSLLTKSADPTKTAAANAALVKAQDKVTQAQQRYNETLGKSGTSVSTHLIDIQKLQDAESTYAANLSKYGANTVQTQSSLVSVETARNRLAGEGVKGSAAVEAAARSLATAQTNLATAQGKVNTLGDYNNATLAKLHIHAYDAKGDFIGMRNLIMDLHDAYAKLNPQQQQAMSAQLFGSPAASAMTGIINGGAQAWDKYAANIGKAGAAHKGALAATQTLGADLERMKAKASGAAQEMAIRIEPLIKGIITTVTSWIPIAANVFGALMATAGGVFNLLKNIGSAGFGPFHIWQLVVGVMGLMVVHMLAMKAIGFAKEVAGWVTPLVKLVGTDGLMNKMQLITGTTKEGSLGKNLKDLKATWGDAFSASQISKLADVGKGMEDAATKVDNLSSRISALKNLKAAAPGLDISEAEKNLNTLMDDAKNNLSNAVSKAYSSGFSDVISNGIKNSVTDSRVTTAATSIADLVGNAAKGSVSKAVKDGVDAAKVGESVASDITASGPKIAAAGDTIFAKFGQSVGSGIVTDLKDSEGAITKVLNDATTASKLAPLVSDATRTGDIIGSSLLSKISPALNYLNAATAQPVWIMGSNVPLGGGDGGHGGGPNPVNALPLLPRVISALGGMDVIGATLVAGLSAAGVITALFAAIAIVDPKATKVSPTDAPGAKTPWAAGIFSDFNTKIPTPIGKLGALDALQASQNRMKDVIKHLEAMGMNAQQAQKDALIIQTAWDQGAINGPQAMNNIVTYLINAGKNAQQLSATIAAMGLEVWSVTSSFASLHPGYNPASGMTAPQGGNLRHTAGGGWLAPGEASIVGEFGQETAVGGPQGTNIIPHGVKNLPDTTQNNSNNKTTNIDVTVNNPIPEPASTSVASRLRMLSYIGYSPS